MVPSSCVKDLGVFLDPTLSMHNHISAVCSAANYEIRKIASVRNYLTLPAVSQLASTLVLSRIDYCNSLFVGLPDTELSRLQIVQNNAARMIFRRSKRHNVSPLLQQLHWLPVKYRVKYKIATLAFQKFQNTLPACLSDLLCVEKKKTNVVTRISLEKRLKPLTEYRTKTHGERLFAYQAPQIWNSLPATLRESESMPVFKARLKTHLFKLFLAE